MPIARVDKYKTEVTLPILRFSEIRKLNRMIENRKTASLTRCCD